MKKHREPGPGRLRAEKDPILAEVWAAKDRLAARFGYDVELMLRDAQKRQHTGGRKVVSLTRRTPAPM